MSHVNLWEQYNTPLRASYGDRLNASYRQYIVCGMGGSHLAATLVAPFSDKLSIHHDYGLPRLPMQRLRQSLIICVSYSGNTEEVLDVYEEARRHDLALAVVTTGGELLRLAQLHHTPLVQIPSSSMQPRDALGYQLRALHSLKMSDWLPDQVKHPSDQSRRTMQMTARQYGALLDNHNALIYGTGLTAGLAYIWKITLNETGKMPAHYNTLPELNHNELESYAHTTRAKHYAGIIVASHGDHARTIKRAEITQSILNQLFATELRMIDTERLDALLTEIAILQDTARLLARQHNLDPETVPTIEAFKRDMLQ